MLFVFVHDGTYAYCVYKYLVYAAVYVLASRVPAPRTTGRLCPHSMVHPPSPSNELAKYKLCPTLNGELNMSSLPRVLSGCRIHRLNLG